MTQDIQRINELKSYTEYNVSTPTSVFTIGFQYEYNVDHVNVYVDGVEASEAGYTVQPDSHGTITLTPAVPTGVVRVSRETNIDTSAHTFSAGAKFTAGNMDENFEQVRHAQQEVRDAFEFLEYNTLGVVEAAREATERANEAADTVEDLVLGIVPDSAINTWSGRTQEEKNKDVISLLDFNAPYSSDSTTHLQAALDYLAGQGGGVLSIPYHIGVLKINGVVNLRENVVVVCDENLIIDCTARTNAYSFVAEGSIGEEIDTSSNLTIADTVISTVAAHDLSVGDFALIKSQRVCADVDAGAWRLGETTVSASQPFFAEPLQVSKVTGANHFEIYTGLIFPDYRIDKTQETSTQARARTTIQKMNLLKGVSWRGGIFKKETGSVFRLDYCYEPQIHAKFMRGYGVGVEVYVHHSFMSKINVDVERPQDWALNGNNHAAFNSVKDVSSWYSQIKLVEKNGCQGLDQSYTDICCIFPNYDVIHYDSHEDGMTAHGCCYGAVINVYAVNARYVALRNRAPFSKLNVAAINCRSGIFCSTWGGVNCDININAHSVISAGVELASAGVTSTVIPQRNTTISGYISASNNSTANGINVVGYDAANAADSGVIISNMQISGCNRAIRAGLGVNGITINNVNVVNVGSAPPIYLQGSSGHRISNLFVDLTGQDGTGVALFMSNISGSSNQTNYGTPTSYIDYDSIRVVNGKIHGDIVAINYMTTALTATTGFNANLTLNNKNVHASKHIVNIVSNAFAGNARIVFTDALPIGREIEMFVHASSGVTLTDNRIGIYALPSAGNAINIYGGGSKVSGNFIDISTPTKLRLGRIGINDYTVEVL